MTSEGRTAVDLELVTSLERMDAIEPAWQRLLACVGTSRPAFSLSYGWCRHVAAARMSHGGGDFLSPLIAVWWRDSEPIAILPLALVKSGVCRAALALDDPYGHFACILSAPDADVEKLIGLLLARFRASGTADLIRIAKVVESSPLYSAFRRHGMHSTVEHGAVVVDLRRFETAKAYRAALTKRTRRAQRNGWNRLEHLGGVEFRFADNRSDVGDIIARSIKDRYSWMVKRGKTAPAFRDPAYVPALLALADDAPADVNLVGFELKAGGVSLALQWGFLHENRYYAHMSSRNLDYSQYSAGRLILEAIAGACIDRGIEVLELMSPASPYKLQLGGKIVPITDFEMSFTRRGALVVELWRRRFRPALKSGYETLPLSWRGRINKMMHHVEADEAAAD